MFFQLTLCREQVKIPKEKQFILLDGQGSDSTVIQWNAHTVPSDQELGTAAFSVSADNFIAREITFQVGVTALICILNLYFLLAVCQKYALNNLILSSNISIRFIGQNS